jgi:hypothetical protein
VCWPPPAPRAGSFADPVAAVLDLHG